MTRLHSLLGTVWQAAALLLAPPPPNRRGCSYAVTVVTPIYPGQVGELRGVLHAFKPGPGSPLHQVRDVQFARWVVIEQLRTVWRGAPKRPSRLESAYLLFSADLTAPASRADGLPETFFRDLASRIPKQCTDVWGKCRGFPGVADVDEFVDYLTRSQIDMGLYYAAFPDATPDEIDRALKIRRELARFVLEHQHAMTVAPASAQAHRIRQELQDHYCARAPSWGT
ncbi:MAG: hypothetical protein JO262_00685 [Solirubrobacterales bacterium]|nr:hypothetical protein [Solirubrobacterales bacterium]